MKLLIFAHFPESYFNDFGIIYREEIAQAAIDRGAFTTVEGVFFKKLIEHKAIQTKIISYSHTVTHSQCQQLSANTTLEIFKPLPLSGMPVGWWPRIVHARLQAKRYQPDVVHGIRTLEGYGTMAAACRSFAPSIITVHEILRGIPCPLHLRPAFALAAGVVKQSIKRADSIIAISQHVKKNLPVQVRSKCTDIPNPISDVFFSVKKESPTTLLFVGRISKEKGLMEALGAVAQCRKRGLEIPFRVIGGSSGAGAEAFFTECRNFADVELAPGQVQFLGWQSSAQIAEEHRGSRFLIMPSKASYETFGLVIVESMASGTPVITYDTSPMNELIEGGVNGRLSDPDEKSSLGEVLYDAWNDNRAWPALSASAQKFSAQFKIETIVKKHLELYKKLAAP